MNYNDSEDLRDVKTSKLSMFGGVQLKEIIAKWPQECLKLHKNHEYYKV